MIFYRCVIGSSFNNICNDCNLTYSDRFDIYDASVKQRVGYVGQTQSNHPTADNSISDYYIEKTIMIVIGCIDIFKTIIKLIRSLLS